MHDLNKNPRIDVFNAKIVDGAYFSSHYEFPLIKPTYFKPIVAIDFNTAKRTKKYDQWVHFYMHDYIFECLWNNPEKYLPLLKKFRGVITPDYSLFRNMPLVMQIWNTYRNRAIAYWLQNNGINIVTNIRWGDFRSYDFAFEGLEKGGSYAIGSHGCIQDKTDRFYFIEGLIKMVEVLQPETIINYSYYSKDIFDEYKEKGIEIITLIHWSDAGKIGSE